MRLDKWLGKVGFGSRRKVRQLIRSGQVVIDGIAATKDSQIVDPSLQDIEVSGKLIKAEGASYWLLNKPAGVVSAVSDAKHKTVIDCLREEDRKEGMYPIGRLDRDTEGLLLLTTNGPLGYRMLHPKHHVTKVYVAEVNGYLGDDAVSFFESGIVFREGGVCQPASLRILERSDRFSRAEVELSEGKFHQVKKMFLAYGVKVTYLKRIAFGPFQLEEDLVAGEYRALREDEKQLLKNYLD